MVLMAVFFWIVVGVVVGFVASKFVNLRGDDPRLGTGSAVIGAFAGGLLYRIISHHLIGGFNPWSILAAACGATIVVIVWHVVRSRTISRERYVPRQSY